MGWHSNLIGHGSGQRLGLGHGDRRSSWNQFNRDDHNDQNWVLRWHSKRHGYFIVNLHFHDQ